MDTETVPKFIDLVNSYYSFVLLLYALALYTASHTHIFKVVFIVSSLLLASWLGYLAKAIWEQRSQRFGFRVISDVMSYDIGKNNKYTLRFSTTIKAEADHLMVYPIGHQWTGGGPEQVPHLTASGQELLARVTPVDTAHRSVKIVPYSLTASTEGDWQYWFVGLNPPLHRGDTTDIKYSQTFRDTDGTAKPSLYYFVRTSTKRLELNVSFPAEVAPKTITASYTKSKDGSRPYSSNDVQYDADRQVGTWTIEKPKKGYCYRIQWE